LFKALSDPAKAKAISKTVYLPEEILKELDVKEKKVSLHLLSKLLILSRSAADTQVVTVQAGFGSTQAESSLC
jgi:antitoxin component of MazEF toxin-antitoxin module